MSKRYRIEFESMWRGSDSDGKYHRDFIDDNGKGFKYEDAKRLAIELQLSECTYNRNINIVEI